MATIDLKLNWPTYKDMSIKAIEEMAEAFTTLLEDGLKIKVIEFDLTADGIVVTVDRDQLSKSLNADDAEFEDDGNCD